MGKPIRDSYKLICQIIGYSIIVMIIFTSVTTVEFIITLLQKETVMKVIKLSTVHNLKTQDQVFVRGVFVGEIVKMDIINDSVILLHCAFEDTINFYEDHLAMESHGGLLGTHYLAIYPGSQGKPLSQSDTLVGIDQSLIASQVAGFPDFMNKSIPNAINSLNKINTETFNHNLENITTKIAQIMTTVDDIHQNTPRYLRNINSMSKAIDQTTEIIHDIRYPTIVSNFSKVHHEIALYRERSEQLQQFIRELNQNEIVSQKDIDLLNKKINNLQNSLHQIKQSLYVLKLSIRLSK